MVTDENDIPMEDLLADSDGASTQDSSPEAPTSPPPAPRRGRGRPRGSGRRATQAPARPAPADTPTERDDEEGHWLRDTSKMIDFTLADEFTVIYPALAVLAIRSDDAPFFYLARVNYDVTAGADSFSITWLDTEPAGQWELYDNDDEDIVALGSVLCRVRTAPEPGTALLRLPGDQREKIDRILAEEEANPEYEYHSSDERLDEPSYLRCAPGPAAGRSEVSNLTGRKRKTQDSELFELSEEDEPQPKRRRGRPRGSTNKPKPSAEEDAEEEEPFTPPPKRGRGRPRLSEEEKARRASLKAATPARRRGRPPRKAQVTKANSDDEEFQMPEELPDLPMEDDKPTPPKRRRRSPSPSGTSPRARSPRGTSRSRSPRRKKNQPALGVQVIEQDPTYCIPTAQVHETCCGACTAKIEPLRATLTDNAELLKELIEDKKRVSQILAPRAVALSVGPMTVAVRRALLTVPESEEDIQEAMNKLQAKALQAAQDKLDKAERKKQQKLAATTGDDGKSARESGEVPGSLPPPLSSSPAHGEATGAGFDDDTDENTPEPSHPQEEDILMADSPPSPAAQLSMSMIEGPHAGEPAPPASPEKALSPLEKILADERNQFTTLRLLLASQEYLSGRLHLPAPNMDRLDTGRGSAYSHRRRSGAIGSSRGGKQGNNALLTDQSVYYSSYAYSDVYSLFQEAMSDTLCLPHVAYPCVRSIRYLFPQYEDLMDDLVPQVLRAGHRRLAARMMDELLGGGEHGLNFLHREVLAFEQGQALSAIRNVTSVTKKGMDQITPLHCACLSPTGHYLEQLLKLKPDALMLADGSGYEPIHYAAAGESPEPLRVLLARNVVLSGQAGGMTPLMIAARYGRTENIQAMMEGRSPEDIKILLEQTGQNKHTAVHVAAIYNQPAVLELLASLATRTAEQIIEQAIAAQAEEAGSSTPKKRKPTCTLRNLLEKPDRTGQTALSLACATGNQLAVEGLLALGAKIDKPDKQKRTPLVHAVMNGFLKIASFLVRSGADPQQGDSSGNTPLHYAAAFGWKELVRFLVSPPGTPDAPAPGAGVPANPYNDWKVTPFGIAVAKRHTGVADVLLQCAEVDINVTDDDGRSLVIQTCCTKITQDACKQLEYFVVDKGADVHCVDMEGLTALHHLVRMSPAYVAPTASASALESYRETSARQLQMIEILLDQGADMTCADKAGHCPLPMAVERGALEVVRLFVRRQAKLDFILPHTGENLLHLLLHHAHQQNILDILQAIREQLGPTGLDSLLQSEDHWGLTPFLFFFRARVAEARDLTDGSRSTMIRDTLVWLLQATEMPLLTQTVGKLKQWREYREEELHAFAQQLETHKKEGAHRMKVEQTLADHQLDSLEQVVAHYDAHDEWAVHPWPAPSSPEDRPIRYTQENRQRRLLHLSPLMRKIMGMPDDDEEDEGQGDASTMHDDDHKNGDSSDSDSDDDDDSSDSDSDDSSDDNSRRGSSSSSSGASLSSACYQESEIALLTPGYSDWGKCSVLHMIPAQSPLLWRWLMTHYAAQLRTVLGQYNAHGYLPLHLTLLLHLESLAHDLIQLGATVNEAYLYGRQQTPLHLAVHRTHKDLVREILHAGASVDGQDAEQTTPLHVACTRRWKKGVLILLHAGASVHHVTHERMSPLHLAIVAGRGMAASFEVEEILLNHQADVNARNLYDQTPLHVAFPAPPAYRTNATQLVPAVADPIETVFSLCEVQGIEVDAPDCMGQSPLAYACLSSALISANNLLAKGADINRYNHDHNSPLALALLGGHADFAISLLHFEARMEDNLHRITREYKTLPTTPPRYYVRVASQRSVPLFRYAVEHNWHGIAYTMLSRGFPYEQAVGDALACSKYQYVEMLLRKARSIARFESKDARERNLFHQLAKICASSDGEWSLRIAKQFRAKHVSPMARDAKGRTPLHYAAMQCNQPLCRYLLALQGEIIENVDSDHEEDVLLLDMGEGEEGLNVSSGCHADPNLMDNAGLSPFAYLFRRASEELFTRRAGEWKSLVEMFLQYKANPNILIPPRASGQCSNLAQYVSPLHMLLDWAKPERTSREAVCGLLEQFFRLPASTAFSLDQPDGRGRPVLFHAIMDNDLELVRLLLRLGAAVDGRDHEGKGALHYVVQPLPYGTYENVALLEVLADAGAPLNDEDEAGHTPYHYARTSQTSPKMAHWFAARLGLTPAMTPLTRTPSRFTTGIQLSTPPDWQADARAALALAQVSKQKVPLQLDPKMTERGHRVLYHDPDEPERAYHAIMTRVDVRLGSCGQNDFYKLQIAHDTHKDLYILFTKWGRIGTEGQYQRTPFAHAEDAIKEFEKVFKQKTGTPWVHYPHGYRRQADKYHVVQEQREITQRVEPLLPLDLLLEERRAQGATVPACSLPLAVAGLMKELCDVKKMKHTVHVEMNLKTPLGFLDHAIIHEALAILSRALAACEELKAIRKAWKADLSQEANVEEIRRVGERIEQLSNEFYQLIPHNCETLEGVPLLDSKSIIATTYQTLDSLGEIATAGRLLLAAQHACRTSGVHPYDYVYACLATQLEELPRESEEFQVVARACPQRIRTILTVIREEEPPRMAKWAHVPNHTLLWHGTSLTNYLGILSHGLQIAPPEAPSTGMLLGKGIYHSDAFVKARGYVRGSPSLLMLNEVVLGTSYTLKAPQYMEKTPPGYNSTQGVGQHQPIGQRSITLPNGLVVHHHQLKRVPDDPRPATPSQFRYNEFVVYDTSQVRMRYLILLDD